MFTPVRRQRGAAGPRAAGGPGRARPDRRGPPDRHGRRHGGPARGWGCCRGSGGIAPPAPAHHAGRRRAGRRGLRDRLVAVPRARSWAASWPTPRPPGARRSARPCCSPTRWAWACPSCSPACSSPASLGALPPRARPLGLASTRWPPSPWSWRRRAGGHRPLRADHPAPLGRRLLRHLGEGRLRRREPAAVRQGRPAQRARCAAAGREVLVHTGQHYDPQLADLFFDELERAAARTTPSAWGPGTPAGADRGDPAAPGAAAHDGAAGPGAGLRRHHDHPGRGARGGEARAAAWPTSRPACAVRPDDARGAEPRGHRPPLLAALLPHRRGRGQPGRARGSRRACTRWAT